MPLFILFCPVAGFVLEKFLKQKSISIGLLFFLGALPWLFLNAQHPWADGYSIWRQPRQAQYFYKRPQLALPYVVISKYIKSIGCQQIGLEMAGDDWEYPWWVFLAGEGVRIEHVSVNNSSASLKYPLGAFQACAIIVTGPQVSPLIVVGSSFYSPVWSTPVGDNKITVYKRGN